MLTIGDYQIDEGKIAAPVVNRLLQRAIAHILNNEASASVLNKTKRAIADAAGKDDKGNAKLKPEGVTAEQLETWRTQPDNAKQIATWEDEFCQAKIASMYDGSLSVRVARGPTRDPVEAAARAIAKMEVTQVLKSNGAKFPTKDETVTLGDQEFSGDDLIDRRLAHAEHGPRVRKLAERKVAEDNRLRDATAKAAAGGVADL